MDNVARRKKNEVLEQRANDDVEHVPKAEAVGKVHGPLDAAQAMSPAYLVILQMKCANEEYVRDDEPGARRRKNDHIRALRLTSRASRSVTSGGPS